MSVRIDIVATDAIPEYLNAVSLDIFRMWREFALGQRALGRTLMHPTGKYASSISMHRYGTRVTTVREGREFAVRQISHIAIIASSPDENIEKQINSIEYGHEMIDMLDYLDPNTRYPMHRSGMTPPIVSGGEQAFPRSAQGRGRVRQMWAQTRHLQSTGSARTPADKSQRGDSNTSGTGPAWTIPAMPAYEPAHILAELFAQSKGLEITVS